MTRPTRKELREDCYIALIKYYAKELKLPFEKILQSIKAVFTETIMNQWLNAAQSYVVRQTGCLYGQATAPVLAQTLWFKIWDLSLAPLTNAVKWSDEDVTDKVLIPKEQLEIDAMQEDWESVDGESYPKNYVYMSQQGGDGSGQSIKFYPKPHKAGTLKLRCLRLPNEMTDDDDKVALEGEHYQAIIDAVIIRALEDTKKLLELKTTLITMASESRERTQDRQIRIGGWEDHPGL